MMIVSKTTLTNLTDEQVKEYAANLIAGGFDEKSIKTFIEGKPVVTTQKDPDSKATVTSVWQIFADPEPVKPKSPLIMVPR